MDKSPKVTKGVQVAVVGYQWSTDALFRNVGKKEALTRILSGSFCLPSVEVNGEAVCDRQSVPVVIGRV